MRDSLNKDQIDGACSTQGVDEKYLNILVRKTQRKINLRCMHTEKYNIKMDLKEDKFIRVEYWIQLSQDNVQWRASLNTVMSLQVLPKSR
jgi:hypothetical protein